MNPWDISGQNIMKNLRRNVVLFPVCRVTDRGDVELQWINTHFLSLSFKVYPYAIHLLILST